MKYRTPLILLAVSFLFEMLFSLWTSPFYKHWYGCDASFFSMVGRGITMGKLPYRDFFDLKGPYFFFIEALGQFIHKGRTGVFITQVLFMWMTLILITKISRLFLNRAKTIAVLIIFLFVHISMIWGGNTLEEYMLPLILLVYYLTLRFLKEKDIARDSLPFYIPLASGIVSGIILFGKVTVAAPIAGLCVAVFFCLIIYRRFRELLMYVLYFILGMLTAIAPVIVFFYLNRCLSDMLYCVFRFAYLRGTDFAEPFNIKWELKLSACFIGFLTGLLHLPGLDRAFLKLIKRKTPGSGPYIPFCFCLILIFASLFTYVVLHLGDPWIYYFISTEPIMLLSVILLLDIYDPLILFSGIREAVCLFLLGVFIFYYGMNTMDTVQTVIYDRGNNYYSDYYTCANDLALLIPVNERDSVFSLDTDMTFFEATGLMPCNRYQINLQFFIALNPDILTDLQAFFAQTPPKWMIISPTLDSYIPELYDTVISKYHLISENMAGCLYILDEERIP
ncbi:MAG: glycosyltransferase family 39 protein [Lachnospiraceae bacterium]|nr:glycosyltransferase family 39 protein [Lachnospiraceae bacterium]